MDNTDENKAKKWKQKADTFMAEMVEDTLDPQTITDVETKIRTVFKQNSIPYRKTELTAFAEGMTFMLSAVHFEGDPSFHLGLVPIIKAILQKVNVKLIKATDDALNQDVNQNEDAKEV